MKLIDWVYPAMVLVGIALWFWGLFDIHRRLPIVTGWVVVTLLVRVVWKREQR